MLSKTLAQFIENTNYEDLPEDVVSFTKLCIMDWYGSALAGRDKAPVQMIIETVKEMGGNPQATLVTGEKTSVAQAALANGAASHIVELDDIHKGSIIHAATVVVPAALAVAEWKQSSGKELIAAVAIGYDVCYRIGEAVSPSHYYYWHNTATCGTFGAATAAAKLLELTENQIVSTLGSAGTQAAGLWEFIVDGANSKQLHPGKAAYNGVLSAMLAEKGFTAAQKILEGDRGFFNAMSEQYDANKVTDQLGEIFKITENSFKIHASCRHTHPTVDLILDLVKEHDLQASDLQDVQIQTYKTAIDIAGNANPDTVYASKFSIEFDAALAFLRRQAALGDFNKNSLKDPDIRSLMEKIEVSVGSDIDEQYPEKWGGRIEITLNDGRHFEKETGYPKGDPENPVTADELKVKFRDMTQPVLGEKTDRVAGEILSLEQSESAGGFLNS